MTAQDHRSQKFCYKCFNFLSNQVIKTTEDFLNNKITANYLQIFTSIKIEISPGASMSTSITHVRIPFSN